LDKIIKRGFLTGFLILLSCLFSLAQPYTIGHTTITFNDPNRTGGFGSGGGPGRQIQIEIYYPATMQGDNTPIDSGQFPVIIFGHGFAMSWDAYQNIWEHFVPMGYVIAFPRTEGSLIPAPSHADFGLDLKQVAEKMQLQSSDQSSPFYQALTDRTAIIGHSMGGGASVLAAANDTNIATMVGLAPAETDPSAIAAAPDVTVPAVIFSGTSDAVTPPADNHIPIYNALSSECKTLIHIINGSHCYFANSNFNCDFAETSVGGSGTLPRLEQHDITFDFLDLWLDYTLKQNPASLSVFNDSLSSSSRITFEQDCNTVITGVAQNNTALNYYPNPTSDFIILENSQGLKDACLHIYDMYGRLLFMRKIHDAKESEPLDFQDLPAGVYVVYLTTPDKSYIRKVIKK